MAKKNRKKKKKQEKVKDLDEFRKLHTTDAQGHVNYVCGRKGKSLQSLGVTHGGRTKGVRITFLCKRIPIKKIRNRRMCVRNSQKNQQKIMEKG